MKTLVILILVLLFGTLHADLLTTTFYNYDPSYQWTQNPAADVIFPVSQTFTAQTEGPAFIQGYILLGQGSGSVAVIGTYIDILLDGTAITTTPLPFWNYNNYFAISIRVAPGIHTLTFRRRGTGTYHPSDTPASYNTGSVSGLGALFATILINDAIEDFQMALDQLRDALLTADTTLKADLVAMIQNVQNLLQAEIDALTTRVAALETSQPQQDAEITQLQGQVSDMQSAMTQLQTTIQQLQQQIANLPASSDPVMVQGQTTSKQKPQIIHSSNNNTAWWGVAAGAGAGIGAAIIANQFSSRGEAAADSSESYETH